VWPTQNRSAQLGAPPTILILSHIAFRPGEKKTGKDEAEGEKRLVFDGFLSFQPLTRRPYSKAALRAAEQKRAARVPTLSASCKTGAKPPGASCRMGKIKRKMPVP
jgi:hypothetical protein